MKDNKTILGCLLLFCASVFAPFVSSETYFVVGSYNDRAKAESARKQLISELNVQISIVEVEVAEVTRYRLMYADSLHSEDIANSMNRLAIEPWRITLKDEVDQSPVSDNLNKGETLLVAEFRDISDALALERKLGGASLPVFGKAVAKDGNILHQVWIGPVSNPQAVLAELKSSNLQPSATAPAVELNSVVEVQPRIPSSAPTAKKVTSSKKYPADFNLARLREKKPKP